MDENTQQESEEAHRMLRLIKDLVEKRRYSNALAWTLDLAKELHKLQTDIIRHTMQPKSTPTKE